MVVIAFTLKVLHTSSGGHILSCVPLCHLVFQPFTQIIPSAEAFPPQADPIWVCVSIIFPLHPQPLTAALSSPGDLLNGASQCCCSCETPAANLHWVNCYSPALVSAQHNATTASHRLYQRTRTQDEVTQRWNWTKPANRSKKSRNRIVIQKNSKGKMAGIYTDRK